MCETAVNLVVDGLEIYHVNHLRVRKQIHFASLSELLATVNSIIQSSFSYPCEDELLLSKVAFRILVKTSYTTPMSVYECALCADSKRACAE